MNWERTVFACSRISACLGNSSARASGPTSLAAASPRSARWLQRYAAFIGTKRGLAKALHSGNPAFDTLPAYFNERLEPALRGLLESAGAAGEVRTDVAAEGLLGAVAGLCMQAYNKGPEYASRMVALLVDGLRYGAKSAKSKLS